VSRIANRPLTKPSEPHRFADLVQVLTAILLLIIPAFLYASQRADLHRAQRRARDLEAELSRLEERRELLTLELEAQLDPRRLEERARTIALMQEPEDGQILYLSRPGEALRRPALVADVAGGTDGHR